MRAPWPCLAVLVCAAGCCDSATTPPAGTVSIIDVATSSANDGWAVNYPKQRKVLYMAGRLWVFYSDGSDMLVRSTADGMTLTPPQTVRSGMVFGHRCMMAFDGVHLHYACNDALPGSAVFYRRGTPRDDGTIDWPVAEQIAFDVPAPKSVLYPKIMVDVAGRIWVSFMLFQGGFMVAPESALVTRSSRTDGTWATDAGFPFMLAGSDSTDTYPDPLGVALASGGAYFVYDHGGEDTYYGRAWSEAAGWAAEEAVTTSRQKYGLFDAVADGDAVHLSFGGGTVHYRRRAPAGTWGAERTVGTGSGHTSIAALGHDHALVTWLDFRCQRVLQREIWEDGDNDIQELIDGHPAPIAGPDLGINLNGLAASAGGFRTAITTTLGTGAPYRVVLATAR